MPPTLSAPRRHALSLFMFWIMLGTLAGFINGLLGTGGGIFLVLLLLRASKQSRNKHIHIAIDPRDIYATALSVMLPISVFSAVQYTAAGALDFRQFSPFILPSLLGGLIGGVLLDRLRLSRLKSLFSLLLLISGILLLIRR